MVPASATATLDIRFLPGQGPEDFVRWIEEMAAETRKDIPEAEFQLRQTGLHPATEVPQDNPLVRIIQEATLDIAGRRPRPVGISGATVTKQLIRRGIAAVGFSAGDADMAHVANENIAIDEVMTFAKVIVMVAVRLLGIKE